MTDALVPFDVAALESLPDDYDAKVDPLAAAYRDWGRLESERAMECSAVLCASFGTYRVMASGRRS